MKNLNEQLVSMYKELDSKTLKLMNEDDKDDYQVAMEIDKLSSDMATKFVKLFESLEDISELSDFIENDKETSEDYKELVTRLAISKLSKDMIEAGFIVIEMNDDIDIPGGSGKMN